MFGGSAIIKPFLQDPSLPSPSALARMHFVLAAALAGGYASRQFDNLQHTRRDSLKRSSSGLIAVSYRSKTDQFGAGLTWIIVNAILKGCDLVEVFLGAFQSYQDVAGELACIDYLWPLRFGGPAELSLIHI